MGHISKLPKQFVKYLAQFLRDRLNVRVGYGDTTVLLVAAQHAHINKLFVGIQV